MMPKLALLKIKYNNETTRMDRQFQKNLKAMPDSVQDNVGFALFLAQLGEKYDDAKPFKGFKGSGVLEVVDNFEGDTYRAVYTVRLEFAVYVLHVFQKRMQSR